MTHPGASEAPSKSKRVQEGGTRKGARSQERWATTPPQRNSVFKKFGEKKKRENKVRKEGFIGVRVRTVMVTWDIVVGPGVEPPVYYL